MVPQTVRETVRSPFLSYNPNLIVRKGLLSPTPTVDPPLPAFYDNALDTAEGMW